MRDLLLAVSQVEVDLSLGAASRFSFTVVNSYSLKAHAFVTGRGEKVLELLGFGAEVEHRHGLWRCQVGAADGERRDHRDHHQLSGIGPAGAVDRRLRSRFSDDHRQEFADLVRMRSTATRPRRSPSFHNLTPNIERTTDRHPQIEQNQESDFEFLKKLADRNHFELFVDETKTLHFRKPNDTATAVVRLVWGEGLLSFKPEANLAGQIAKVEVYGWDRNKKEKIVGIARAGEESGKEGKGKSAGERLNAFVKDPSKQPVLRLRQPVFTQAEAEERAKAALNERAKQFLTGEAEAIGLPDIRPDRNVEFANLGEPFSKTYYIQQSTHKIDCNGYRTRFKVKETAL